MTQYYFTTNIEHRMPDTGKLFCIDRMTSDYAEQHLLDVDGFIESVYQEFAGTEFEESRETLRGIWTAVLSVKSPRGDASLYPNKNGRKRAAAMKVWTKAGDYWRRGLRYGDTLPDMVPMCKITRLVGGWIALFPKDAHLLSEKGIVKSEEFATAEETDNTQETTEESSSTPKLLRDYESTESEHTPSTAEAEPSVDLSPSPDLRREEPRQLDLFAQLQQENEVLQARIAELERQEQQHREQEERDRAERFAREEQQPRDRQCSDAPKWKRKLEEQWRVNHPYESSHAVAAAVLCASASGSNHAWLKTAGYIAAASIALLVIWQTGLIIPLGLIGLATSGLLK